MERREKRALAFLLAASLLCLALVGLAAGDPPAERAEALFRAGREEFDRAAAELPGCAQELGELARCLDQLYFGGGAPAFSPARASALRRALRLASRPPERPARH